jgi:hypothetical protein
MHSYRGWFPIALMGAALWMAAVQEPTPPSAGGEGAQAAGGFSVDEVRFFEERIRPLLAAHCFECHGPELPEVKGGLRMSGRDALIRGGPGEAVLLPGDPEASPIVAAVRYDGVVQMPPDAKLGDDRIHELELWVAMGAPWPDYGGGQQRGPEDEREIDYESGRQWWAFRPVSRPAVPSSEAGVAPIDAFLNAGIAAAGSIPAPPASRHELIRRATFDLVGLPPTLAEVRAFVDDPAPDAWERLIERLLARPQYGERWGRHWLDLVRFAQTNGYERDNEKPLIWRYRDWVVRSFNEDKPYDRFLLEQLAGDELEEVTRDSLIATGFYRLGVWDDEPNDPDEAVFDELDDVLRTISEGMLGVTVGCARCHDHKFDPISQQDYYGMLAFVRNLRPYELPTFTRDSSSLRVLDGTPATLARWERERARELDRLEQRLESVLQPLRDEYVARFLASASNEIRAACETPAADRSAVQARLIEESAELDPDVGQILSLVERPRRREIRNLMREVEKTREDFRGSIDWALTVKEHGSESLETRLLLRGRAATPGPVVEPSFLRVACASDAASLPTLAGMPKERATSGRRRALAEWIVSPANPLTARVLVNRVWQFHFGRGIVPTPNDFGKTGLQPTHPELLDWLASEFVAAGWSIKDLHRRIMTSAAYRRSSRAGGLEAQESDPDNRMFRRQNLRRLEAEVIRDSILAVAGTLNSERGGRGFFPRLSRAAMARHSRPGEGWEISAAAERNRRSLYVYVKRSMLLPLFEIFDYPTSSLPTGLRPSTTIPTQALTLLNNHFTGRQATAFARRVIRDVGSDTARQVERAFELALSRSPTPVERDAACDFIHRQTEAFAGLGSRLTFQPRVPPRLGVFFELELEGEDMLFGPRAGWTYVTGAWGDPYNATVGVHPGRGYAALYDAMPFTNGALETRVRLGSGCEQAGLIVRGRVDGDVFLGIEVRLLPEGRIEVMRHGEEVERLSTREVAVTRGPRGQWHLLRIELEGPRVSVWLDGTGTELTLADDRADFEGQLVGVRTVGGRLELDGLRFGDGDALDRQVTPDSSGTPEFRALTSLCLALFNTNEFLYVD